MASKHQDLFNAKLQEFVNDLSTAFPDVQDFKIYQNALALAVSFSPGQPRAMFHTHVATPFATHILAKDEAFFFGDEFTSAVRSGGDFDIVQRISGVWKRMSAVDQESVWKYMQVLLLLDRKCG